MSVNPISVAVIGLGRVGWSVHYKALAENPNFKLLAVADPLEERRQEAERECPGCVAYPDLDTLLAKCDAELIVDATPTFLHESNIGKIYQAGRHCLLEKPMSFDYHGARRIADVAKQSGKQLFIHHQHMFGAQVHMLKHVIDSGKLGRVFSIRFNWGHYSVRNDWQTLKKNGGGLLNNHGPHAFTVLTPLMDGEIKNLSAFLYHAKDAGDVEDHAEIFITTDKEQAVSLLLSTTQAISTPGCQILGQYGSFIQEGVSTDGRMRYYDPSTVFPLEAVDGANKARSYSFVPVPEWKEETVTLNDFKPQQSFHDNIYDAIRHGAQPLVTVASALQVMRILTWARTGSDPQ